MLSWNLSKVSLLKIKSSNLLCLQFKSSKPAKMSAFVICKWLMDELDTSCERDCLAYLVICEWARHELWMRWAWTLRDKNLSSGPSKNFYKKSVRNWGQAGTELFMTKASDWLALASGANPTKRSKFIHYFYKLDRFIIVHKYFHYTKIVLFPKIVSTSSPKSLYRSGYRQGILTDRDGSIQLTSL